MCGIAGLLRLGDEALVRRMTDVMAYRGPDDSGVATFGDCVLGHRRLSILDLSDAGHQPMVTDDGAVAIVHNGEVYNFLLLRAELERQGVRFRTGTDTEVLLEGYRAWGLDLLRRIDGMFAFALWDDRDRRLLLARDRTGIKPLFYRVDGDALAFASELKPFLLLPGFEPRANRRALRSALRFACNMEAEAMLAGVRKLLPGRWLTWKDGVVEEGAYWTHPDPRPSDRPAGEMAEDLRDRLSRVVEGLMISDAPLGAALSGGLDSSGIVALMARTGATVDTFTVGHGEDDPDLRKARVVVEHCKTRHHEILVDSGDVAELLAPVMWHLEEPMGQMEALQMFVNYREAAKHVKVLLVGEGADECFAGYDRYKLFDSRLPLPPGLRKDLYERVFMYADEPPRTLLGRALARAAWGPLPPSPMVDPHPRHPLPSLPGGCATALEHGLSFDQRTWLHHLALKRADATGMAHSLEIRVPFLEREIVEFTATVPGRMFLNRGVEKWILREALRPVLPASIVDRPKRPFQMRMNAGLVETLERLSDRLLRPEDVRARGFFDPAKVDALRRGRPGRFHQGIAHKVWAFRLWSLLLCETWARTFLDRDVERGMPSAEDLFGGPA
ncbi:MAG: asparagine synthase (glutamine-hydrolyzing) [Planctomycetota bacterium JB042]